MRTCKALLVAGAAQALWVTPAWAHPSTGFHVHGVQLVPLLAVAVGAALMLRRSRSRAR